MFVVKILFMLCMLSSLRLCKCYNIRVHDALLKNNVDRIIHKYVKPLSERFPNHEVEVQIEYQGPHPTKRNSRKRIYVYQPPHLRAGVEIPSTFPAATNPLPTAPTTEKPYKPPATDDTRTPIFKEDLDKAFADFEKKLTLTMNANKKSENFGGNYVEAEDSEILVSNPDPVHGSNIERIVDLLKKGVHLQKHVPKPQDDNLEWMQIKIPKHNNK